MKNQLFFSAFLLLSAIFILTHVTDVNSAPTCTAVTTNAASCLSFAIGKGKDTKPSSACCTGLQALARTVKTVDDKKTICRCLKASAKNLKGIQDKFLSQIPSACKITVGFPVSINVNCETIH